jgi:hypothetical protein
MQPYHEYSRIVVTRILAKATYHKNAVVIIIRWARFRNCVILWYINAKTVSWKVSCIADLNENKDRFSSHSSLQIWVSENLTLKKRLSVHVF